MTTAQDVSPWWIVAITCLFSLPMFTFLFWTGWGKKWWRNRKVGKGMARKRGTWTIEYGDNPDPSRYSGYDSTTTAHMIAESHDEAVALLKEYDPKFNPKYIVKSERSGIEYIIAEPHREN